MKGELLGQTLQTPGRKLEHIVIKFKPLPEQGVLDSDP